METVNEEQVSGQNQVRVGKAILGSITVLLQTILVCYLVFTGNQQPFCYLLPAIPFAVHCLFWKNSNIPNWLIGTSGAFFFAQGILITYFLLITSIPLFDSDFGTAILFSLGFCGGAWLLIYGGVIIYADKIPAIFGLIALLCFAIVGFFTYFSVEYQLSIWHQIAAFFVFILGVFWGSKAAGNYIGTFMLLLAFILCCFAALYCTITDYRVGEVLCIGGSGAVFSFAFMMKSTVGPVIEGESSASIVFQKILVAVIYVVSVVGTIAPFVYLLVR